jgi:carotenoid cleavage oxygenase
MTETQTPQAAPSRDSAGPAVHNRYLEGNFAPVPDEITATDLEVIGSVPEALQGRYLRTGPNPFDADPANHHWFVGDGMVHGIELAGGRANWYRNRWVRSPAATAHLGQPEVPAPDGGGLFAGSGNTNVIHHAGGIFAINELSLPYEITPELDTVRRWDFGGPLPAGMNAHPKFDPFTLDLHVMAYSFVEPFCWYHVIDAGGALVRSEPIAMGGPVMVHDMGLTQTYALVLDLPVVFDQDAALAGRSLPYAWDDDYTPRVGLLPRAGTADDTVWIEVDPCYVFHPLNAYDDAQGRVVVDLVRHPSMFRAADDSNSLEGGRPRLERWTLDPATRTVATEIIDDRAQEFPRADERLATVAHRYGYAMGAALRDLGGTDESTAVLKHDVVAGTTQVVELGPGRVGGEFVFVPAQADAGEDEGWLLGLVHDGPTDRSELVILDAHDFGPEPVATVKLPRRVPVGFHGNWIPD